MIPKIKYIAVYQVSPISAITYVAPVASIEPYKDTGKYCVTLAESAQKTKHIKLVTKGRVKALQSLRYTSYEKLTSAKNLDEVF